MIKYVAAYLGAGLTFAAIDFVWLTNMTDRLYRPVIGPIMAAKPDFMFGAVAGKDDETFMQQAAQMGLFKRVPFPGGLIAVNDLKAQRKTLPRGIIVH